jgi:hypothetical protein
MKWLRRPPGTAPPWAIAGPPGAPSASKTPSPAATRPSMLLAAGWYKERSLYFKGITPVDQARLVPTPHRNRNRNRNRNRYRKALDYDYDYDYDEEWG